MDWLRAKLFDLAEGIGLLARSIKNGWHSGYRD